LYIKYIVKNNGRNALKVSQIINVLIHLKRRKTTNRCNFKEKIVH
jgi:hypothetical protein